MKGPLVSILINNYNYGNFLAEAIDSALGQSYGNIEVVVVDDGSTDNSLEIIEGYCGRVVAVVKENGGQASAFNAGFARSKGEIVCFLDSDDLFLPEKVAAVVDVFQRYPEIGWCFHYPKLVRFVDGSVEEVPDKSVRTTSQICDFRAEMLQGRLKFHAPPTSGLCFRRETLEKVLPMPEEIRITSDNYIKFVSQALAKGYCLNQELALQRIHGNNAYTLRKNKKLNAVIDIQTAYHIKKRHPQLVMLTNRYFARGISIYFRCGTPEKEHTSICREYLSSLALSGKFHICCQLLSWLIFQTRGKVISLLAPRS
jgi:glycosyltransferase involved in cell wall biosynthesis